MAYHELSIEERSTIQVSLAKGLGIRAIARLMQRSPQPSAGSSIEIATENELIKLILPSNFSSAADSHADPCRKLVPGSERFELMCYLLRQRLSPEQIAGRLRYMDIPSLKDAYVCRETIYSAIYALPVGELRKELIHCLRQGKSTRKPRRGAVDRRGQIPDMVSIHLRSSEVDQRVMPGHWEGDLIKGMNNAFAVGTLVELSTGYLILAKMNDATATSAVEGFSAALNRMPLVARKTLTYDKGREIEMVRHAEITQKTGVAIYFCDPHSPWQRGSNENINGLICQYLPKGTDLSRHSQEELDAIALELNIRPRKRFDFKCPIEMMQGMMAKHHNSSGPPH